VLFMITGHLLPVTRPPACSRPPLCGARPPLPRAARPPQL